jgi:hypothetical protein
MNEFEDCCSIAFIRQSIHLFASRRLLKSALRHRTSACRRMSNSVQGNSTYGYSHDQHSEPIGIDGDCVTGFLVIARNSAEIALSQSSLRCRSLTTQESSFVEMVRM